MRPESRPAFIGFSCFVTLLSLLVPGCTHSDPGPIWKSVEAEGERFSVRIVARREMREFGQPFAGLEYEVTSRRSGEGNSTDVIEFTHDDGFDFDEENVLFVDENIAIVVLGGRVLLTLDQGQTWQEYDVQWLQVDCKPESALSAPNGPRSVEVRCEGRVFDVPISD